MNLESNNHDLVRLRQHLVIQQCEHPSTNLPSQLDCLRRVTIRSKAMTAPSSYRPVENRQSVRCEAGAVQAEAASTMIPIKYRHRLSMTDPEKSLVDRYGQPTRREMIPTTRTKILRWRRADKMTGGKDGLALPFLRISPG